MSDEAAEFSPASESMPPPFINLDIASNDARH
jgi:hypothetical protein